MMSGPFLELYIVALEQERRGRPARQPTPPHRSPLWARWLAQALVRIAAGVSGAQVRIEWPARA